MRQFPLSLDLYSCPVKNASLFRYFLHFDRAIQKVHPVRERLESAKFYQIQLWYAKPYFEMVEPKYPDLSKPLWNSNSTDWSVIVPIAALYHHFNPWPYYPSPPILIRPRIEAANLINLNLQPSKPKPTGIPPNQTKHPKKSTKDFNTLMIIIIAMLPICWLPITPLRCSKVFQQPKTHWEQN